MAQKNNIDFEEANNFFSFVSKLKPVSNISQFNAILEIHVRKGESGEVNRIFLQILRDPHITPDISTFNLVLEINSKQCNSIQVEIFFF